MDNNQKKLTNHQKEIEAYLKEYEVLRTEIREYIQRIDRYVGIYLAAVFAVIAVFLRPGTEYDLAKYFKKIEQDPYSVGFLLLVPILNSILQIHLLSFMHVILAMAKYTTYVIGNKISAIVGESVLSWDKRFSIWDKEPWLFTRLIAGSAYNILVSIISLSILLTNSNIILLKRGWLLFGLYLIGIFFVALAISVLIRYVFVSKKFHNVTVKKVPGIKWIFVVTFFSLVVITIIFARSSG